MSRPVIDAAFASKWLGQGLPPNQAVSPAIRTPCKLRITRNNTTVTARTVGGETVRAFICQNSQCAVALETKLAGDPEFAESWAFARDPMLPSGKPHGLERPLPPLAGIRSGRRLS